MHPHRWILDGLNDRQGSCIHGRMQAEDNVVELSPDPEAPVAPLSFIREAKGVMPDGAIAWDPVT